MSGVCLHYDTSMWHVGIMVNPLHTNIISSLGCVYTLREVKYLSDHFESRRMLCPYVSTHYLQAPSALLHLGHSIPPLVPFSLSFIGICFRADSLVRGKWLIILGISYPCKEALGSNGKGAG